MASPEEQTTTKKFGLTMKTKKPVHQGGLDALVKLQEKRKPKMFDSDDSDDLDGNTSKHKQVNSPFSSESISNPKEVSLSATEIRQKKQTKFLHERAMAEDPTVFQYDAVYDEIAEKRNEKVESQKKADKERKPKYMQHLMKAAERRNLEYQAREDRKQQKERVEEAGAFDDKEVFVTGAYRKQMEELETYQEEEERRTMIEKRMDVTKQRDLAGFYKHLLNDVARDGTVKHEADRKEPPEASIKKEPQSPPPPANKKEGGSIREGEKKKEKSYRRRRDSGSSSEEASPVRPQGKGTEPTTKHQHSIYSDSDSDSGLPAPPSPKAKGGLQFVKQSREKSRQTKSEKQKRFFTPTPPSSPEPPASKSKKQKLSSPDERKTKSDERPSKREKSSASSEKVSKENKIQFGIKKITTEERLTKLRIAFAKRNDSASIEAYKKRYLERKKAGFNIPL